jgi:hypothetical protein
MKLIVEQLHPSMRAKGCEHLFALLQVSKMNPNIKQTIAENLTEMDAITIAAAVKNQPATLLAMQSLNAIKTVLADHPQVAVGNSKVHWAYHQANSALEAFNACA